MWVHWKKHKTSKHVFSRLHILHSVKQRVSCTLHPVKVTLPCGAKRDSLCH